MEIVSLPGEAMRRLKNELVFEKGLFIIVGTIAISNLILFFFKKIVSAENGPLTFIFIFDAFLIAGRTIFSSSLIL